ncbi:phosphoadenosine phosphosulfate reductase [Ahniella affigens]|uniref:Phosphoadenosine 5'-phosphosulfate reductase n=1 Tax=Ahniella affigens TaxID=2021234 RepID=A0A2P1PLP5_9GAMM|nr:phosphoadenylyl-sulfate reductase [Ahniella affigens]AVP95758.1 phosphoadenosine phosphosulfate reductase [Ahniella affigens]
MSRFELETLKHDPHALSALNKRLAGETAEARVAYALEHLPGAFALSSSFGAQAAVSLSLVTRQHADMPVLLVDTGYLFPETYQFIDELNERLQLNLHVLQSDLSPNWFEARYGKLWEQGLEGINRYNQLRKVAPMKAALSQLGVQTWFAGLRRKQSRSRAELDVLTIQDGRVKVHPIIDWTDRDVWKYLTQHGLPYHPLWHQGYVSIGDTHSTRPLLADMSEEDTRFFGLKRECGLHEASEEVAG